MCMHKKLSKVTEHSGNKMCPANLLLEKLSTLCIWTHSDHRVNGHNHFKTTINKTSKFLPKMVYITKVDSLYYGKLFVRILSNYCDGAWVHFAMNF